MSDGLSKKQPAELACPRCGESIAWRAMLAMRRAGRLGVHCQQPLRRAPAGEVLQRVRRDPAGLGRELRVLPRDSGWLAAEHVCSAADQPPPGKPFRVDPATRPAPALAGAAEATPLPVVTSAPPASPASVPAPVVAAAAAPAAAPERRRCRECGCCRECGQVGATPQPVPGPATPEPKRNNRMNLWIAILFLVIFALLIASPELTDTIRRSFQAVFVR